MQNSEVTRCLEIIKLIERLPTGTQLKVLLVVIQEILSIHLSWNPDSGVSSKINILTESFLDLMVELERG